ncbi:MAG: hypothetical protein J5802_02080 [Butyrivibrio sp.]|nr:hypothetical protein [Butyrivibrio sp.]
MKKKKKVSTITAVSMAALLAISPLKSVDVKAAPVDSISTTAVASSNIVDLTRNDEYKVRDAYYSLSDNSVNRMASEHFQIIWGKSNSTDVRIDEEFIKGNLTNLENIYAFYTQELKMKDIGVSGNSKFKTNLYISNTGLRAFEDNWAYMGTDREGFGFLFVSPGAMVVSDPNPSWVLPHELAHVFTYYQGGTIDYPWYEATANWFRDQFIGSEYYSYHGKKFGPYSDFFSPYLINADYYVPHMLNWYDTWPIFLYISENPDNIDGLGMDLIHKILENKQKDESMYATIERLSGVPIKTILGGMSKRLATMDFSRQKFYLEHLNNETLRQAGNREKIYTTLERPDNEGYQAVPANKAPMQTGFNVIPLDVDLSKGGISADFVNTSGVAGSDFRVTLVTSTADNKTRYSETFSSGTGSIALNGDEKTAYLVVCATPDKLKGYHTDWNSSTNETDTRFTYKVKITTTDGAPAQADNSADDKNEPEKVSDKEPSREPEEVSASKEDNSQKNEATEKATDNSSKSQNGGATNANTPKDEKDKNKSDGANNNGQDNSNAGATVDNGQNSSNTGSTCGNKQNNSNTGSKCNNKQDSSNSGATVDSGKDSSNSGATVDGGQSNSDSDSDWEISENTASSSCNNRQTNWPSCNNSQTNWPSCSDQPGNVPASSCSNQQAGFTPAPIDNGYTQGNPYTNGQGYNKDTQDYETIDLDYLFEDDDDDDGGSFWSIIPAILKKIFNF